MLTNRRNIQIEWGDCDAAGTGFFPRYLEYGDACMNALFSEAELFKPAMIKSYNIIGIPLVDLRARFVVPSDFGDDGSTRRRSPSADGAASWFSIKSSGQMACLPLRSVKEVFGAGA
jgi:acyl-CoA thioesterase FadM